MGEIGYRIIETKSSPRIIVKKQSHVTFTCNPPCVNSKLVHFIIISFVELWIITDEHTCPIVMLEIVVCNPFIIACARDR